LDYKTGHSTAGGSAKSNKMGSTGSKKEWKEEGGKKRVKETGLMGGEVCDKHSEGGGLELTGIGECLMGKKSTKNKRRGEGLVEWARIGQL